MQQITLKPIGYIESNYKSLEEIPRQSVLAPGETAKIIIEKEYQEGLLGLESLSHIIILFYFDKSQGYKLRLRPKHLDENEKLRGVFATRSPNRPNGIGLSIVKLLKVEDNVIYFQGVDMIDGTPVIDIKPYNDDLNPQKA